jgi:hypothetical protein
MKNQANRFMNVFFAMSISAVGTLSQAMEIVSPLQSSREQLANHDESIGRDHDVRDHGHPQPGSGGDQFCQSMDRDEFSCVDLGCAYDRRSGRCSERGQHRPQPRPTSCQRFDYQEEECQDAGCMFDMSSGRCVSQGHIPPAPGYNFTCNASDADGYEDHYSGHQGVGQSQYAAGQAALGDCLRSHRSCVITHCARSL